MKITYKSLSLIVDCDHLPFKPSIALTILGRSYCGPMTAKGMCSENCENCSLSIQKAFQLQNAKKPAALLTWLLKNEVALNQETFHQKSPAKLKKDKYGIPMSETTDTFEKLFSQLGV